MSLASNLEISGHFSRLSDEKGNGLSPVFEGCLIAFFATYDQREWRSYSTLSDVVYIKLTVENSSTKFKVVEFLLKYLVIFIYLCLVWEQIDNLLLPLWRVKFPENLIAK